MKKKTLTILHFEFWEYIGIAGLSLPTDTGLPILCGKKKGGGVGVTEE